MSLLLGVHKNITVRMYVSSLTAGADPGGGGVLGVPPPFLGDFKKREKNVAHVLANTQRFRTWNSYPDQPLFRNPVSIPVN